MKRIILVNLKAIVFNILTLLFLDWIDLLNIYTIIIYVIAVRLVMHYKSYKYVHKPLSDIMSFVNSLEPKHVTSSDIKRFKEIDVTSVYDVNVLSNHIVELLETLRDCSKMIKHLDYESSHDELTGLYNRNKLEKQITYYNQNNWALCVIFFDINNLKLINDEFGHDEGDNLLIRVANQLMYWNSYGEVYRIGGDEFVVVLSNEDAYDAEDKVAEWYSHLRPFNDYESDGFKSELAYGIAFSDNDINFDTLLEFSDYKMYQMKAMLKSC